MCDEYHADEVLALFHHVKYLQLPDIYDIFDISYKTLSVDVKGHHVYICKAEKGEQIEVELTQKEFEMLYVLLINKGIVLTRQKLLNMVWGEDYYGEERIVDTHIKNIRKKLGVNLISTIRGVGYRIDKEN